MRSPFLFVLLFAAFGLSNARIKRDKSCDQNCTKIDEESRNCTVCPPDNSRRLPLSSRQQNIHGPPYSDISNYGPNPFRNPVHPAYPSNNFGSAPNQYPSYPFPQPNRYPTQYDDHYQPKSYPPLRNKTQPKPDGSVWTDAANFFKILTATCTIMFRALPDNLRFR